MTPEAFADMIDNEIGACTRNGLPDDQGHSITMTHKAWANLVKHLRAVPEERPTVPGWFEELLKDWERNDRPIDSGWAALQVRSLLSYGQYMNNDG